jgi:hypothetical protein
MHASPLFSSYIWVTPSVVSVFRISVKLPNETVVCSVDVWPPNMLQTITTPYNSLIMIVKFVLLTRSLTYLGTFVPLFFCIVPAVFIARSELFSRFFSRGRIYSKRGYQRCELIFIGIFRWKHCFYRPKNLESTNRGRWPVESCRLEFVIHPPIWKRLLAVRSYTFYFWFNIECERCDFRGPVTSIDKKGYAGNKEFDLNFLHVYSLPGRV